MSEKLREKLHSVRTIYATVVLDWLPLEAFSSSSVADDYQAAASPLRLTGYSGGMFRWLRRSRSSPPAPLTGAPQVRRQKTYSADSGYVYQYFYEGYRVAEREGATGAEYVFDVSADRKDSFPATVFLSDDVTAAWERARERDLNSTERYAIAKMALFQAFDSRENPNQMREDIRVALQEVEGILDTLGID